MLNEIPRMKADVEFSESLLCVPCPQCTHPAPPGTQWWVGSALLALRTIALAMVAAVGLVGPA